MKKSKTEICANGKIHEIEVKTCSFSDFQSIYLDGKLYKKFKGKPASYHMFYNLYINGKTVTVDIDTSTGALPLAYKYKIYIDGVSIEDGTSIDKERQESLEIISYGFKEYFRKDIKDKLKNGIVTALLSIPSYILGSFLGDFKSFDIHDALFSAAYAAPVTFALVSVGMPISQWIEAKGVVKKWDKRYQPVRTRKEKYFL